MGTPRRSFEPRLATALRIAGGVVVAGAVLAALSSQRGRLAAASDGLARLHWLWLPLAVVAESASIAMFARLQRRLLRAGAASVAISSAIAITYAGNAISGTIPVAGSEMSVAYTYRQFERRGADRAVTAVALAVSGVLSTVTLSLIVATGAVTSGNTAAIWSGLTGGLIALAATAAVIGAFRAPRVERRLAAVAVWSLRTAHRWTGRGPDDPRAAVAAAETRLRQLHLGRVDLAVAGGLAAANWLFDIACLALCIKATGLHVPAAGLILAWAAGSAANSLGLTPGGIGVVEAALIPALVATGLPASGSATAVVTYRIVSLLLPLAVGWVVYVVLRRRDPLRWVAAVTAPDATVDPGLEPGLDLAPDADLEPGLDAGFDLTPD